MITDGHDQYCIPRVCNCGVDSIGERPGSIQVDLEHIGMIGGKWSTWTKKLVARAIQWKTAGRSGGVWSLVSTTASLVSARKEKERLRKRQRREKLSKERKEKNNWINSWDGNIFKFRCRAISRPRRWPPSAFWTDYIYINAFTVWESFLYGFFARLDGLTLLLFAILRNRQ